MELTRALMYPLSVNTLLSGLNSTYSTDFRGTRLAMKRPCLIDNIYILHATVGRYTVSSTIAFVVNSSGEKSIKSSRRLYLKCLSLMPPYHEVNGVFTFLIQVVLLCTNINGTVERGNLPVCWCGCLLWQYSRRLWGCRGSSRRWVLHSCGTPGTC